MPGDERTAFQYSLRYLRADHIYSDTGLLKEEMAVPLEDNFFFQDSEGEDDDDSYWEEDTACDTSTISMKKDFLGAAPFVEGLAQTKAFFYVGEQSFDENVDSEAENDSFSTSAIPQLTHVWEKIDKLEKGQEPPATLVTEIVNIFRDLGRSVSEVEESLLNYNDFLEKKVCRLASEPEKDNETVSCDDKTDDNNDLCEETKELERLKKRSKSTWRIACRKGKTLHKKLLMRNSLKLTLLNEIKWKTEIEQEVDKLQRQTAEMFPQTKLPQVLTKRNEGGESTSLFPMFHMENGQDEGCKYTTEACESSEHDRLELPKLK